MPAALLCAVDEPGEELAPEVTRGVDAVDDVHVYPALRRFLLSPGSADIAAGSDVWDGSSIDEGRAWVFCGRSGLPASSPSWTAVGSQGYAYMGDSVSSAGDVNGDGYGDLIVGIYGWDDAFGDSGAARTITFILRGACFPGQGYKGMDLQIHALKGDAVIHFVRVIKLDP